MNFGKTFKKPISSSFGKFDLGFDLMLKRSILIGNCE